MYGNKDENEEPHTSLLFLAGPILVMTLSIVAVVVLFLAIGHIGPTYSANVMSQQQARLRHQYGLPPEPIVTNPKNIANSTFSQTCSKQHELQRQVGNLFNSVFSLQSSKIYENENMTCNKITFEDSLCHK